MFVKHYAPKYFFGHRCFVQLDKSVQNKLHKCMKQKFILGNCYLNNLKQFWHIWPTVTLTFDPVTLKSIGFLCYQGRMCGSNSLEIILAHLTAVALIFDSVTKITRVPLLPRMNVWTKFEEGRSRHSWVIDQKQKGYMRTNQSTDRPTCPLFFEGGHNKWFLWRNFCLKPNIGFTSFKLPAVTKNLQWLTR